MSRCLAVFLGLFAYGAMAAEPVGTPVSFLACPIARDTGPEVDLCFFTEHDGKRYALTNPPDFGSPQLKHRVLVEGRVKDGPTACGGTVLEGRVSVMTELDASCNTVVPFDNVIKGVAGGVFNSGSPQQRAYAQDLAQRAAQDPVLSLEPAILDPPATPKAAPPFLVRNLLVIYPFDSDRGPGPDMLKLKDLVDYALTAKAKRVEVIGYRADSRLSDGTELSERGTLAKDRAQKVAEIIAALGYNKKLVNVRWEDGAIPGKGDEDWRNRKVEVTVTP